MYVGSCKLQTTYNNLKSLYFQLPTYAMIGSPKLCLTDLRNKLITLDVYFELVVQDQDI